MSSPDGAPWPYEDGESQDETPGVPTWECPDGTCQCHPVAGNAELHEYRLLFHDERARLMPGARCRVFENGRQVNLESPYADGRGAVIVKVRHAATQLYVEWAPTHTPIEPHLPFRRRYFTSVLGEREQAAHRRLHNIGFFGRATLRDAILDFERAYRRKETGELDAIERDLEQYHDKGTLPPLPDDSTPGGEHGSQLAFAAPGGGPKNEVQGSKSKTGNHPAGPPPVAPGPPTGVVAAPQLTVLKLELIIEWRRNERVADARVDVTAAKPPSIFFNLTTYTSDKSGIVTVPMPNLSKPEVLAITVAASAAQESPSTAPASPATTKTLSDDLEKKIDAAFPNRAKVAKDIEDAERNWLDLEDEKARIDHEIEVLKKTTVKTQSDQAALVALNKERLDADAKRLKGKAEHDKLYQDMKRSEQKVHKDAVETVTEYLFRSFEIHVPVGKGGVVDGLKAVLPPRSATDPIPYNVVIDPATTSSTIRLRWKPDWVRAPARLFEWHRPKTMSPILPGVPGLGGEPCVVLHQTGGNQRTGKAEMGSLVNNFTRLSKVEGIHYLVDADGHVVKFVDDHYQVDHAAPAVWEKKRRVAYRSIGIEIVHSDKPSPTSFPSAQMAGVKRLVKAILDEFKRIAPRRVIGHGDIQHKTTTDTTLHDRILNDPGKQFEWKDLAKDKLTLQHDAGKPTGEIFGVGPNDRIVLQPQRVPASIAKVKFVDIRAALEKIGYSVSSHNRPASDYGNIDDDPLWRALAAFQARVLPLAERQEIKLGDKGTHSNIWVDYRTVAELDDMVKKL